MKTNLAVQSGECCYPMTAHLISNARNRSGLNQQEFIDKHNLSITQATLSRWETGQIQVSTDVLLKLDLVKAVQ